MGSRIQRQRNSNDPSQVCTQRKVSNITRSLVNSVCQAKGSQDSSGGTEEMTRLRAAMHALTCVSNSAIFFLLSSIFSRCKHSNVSEVAGFFRSGVSHTSSCFKRDMLFLPSEFPMF